MVFPVSLSVPSYPTAHSFTDGRLMITVHTGIMHITVDLLKMAFLGQSILDLAPLCKDLSASSRMALRS